MKRSFLILGLIIALAFLLRFYNLSSNPPALNLDEVAIGYNAYSILKTGKDEYGISFPLAFRSHDDYKPPLYIYLTVPSVAIFGENEFAVRFPSALIGVLSVLAVFFLVKEIFPGKNKLALVAALLLAISPWSLQFTRSAYEVGSTAFFTSFGLLLFLKGFKQDKIFLVILSAVVFGLELFLYQSAKVFVPLFLFAIFLIYIRKINKNIIVFGLAFVIFFLPIAYQSTTPEGQLRFKGTSVFQKDDPKKENDARQIGDWLRGDRFAAEGYHQPFLSYKDEIFSGYLSHFRPDFLFVGKWGPPINFIPGVGLLYFWELPCLLLGLYFIWKRQDKRPAVLFTVWLLLAPIPSALTAQAPSSIRSGIALPAFQIITALGILALVKWSKIFIPILLLVVSLSVLYMAHMNFVHGPLEFSKSWYYSYKELVKKSQALSGNYDKVIVSTALDQPQNFYAFYLRYDPKTYLEIDGGTVSGGFSEDRNSFSKYSFKPINYNEMSKSPDRILFVGIPEEFPSEIIPIAKLSFLNGETSAIIVGKR